MQKKQKFITDSKTIKKVLGLEIDLLETVMYDFYDTDLFHNNDDPAHGVIWGDFLYHFNKEQLLTILNEIDEKKYGNKEFKLMKRDLKQHNTVMKKLNLLIN